jgi:hypothetical protein
MAKDLRPPNSVLAVLSNPHPSTAVLHRSHAAALKSLSTHGCPFRRLWRCVFWSELHRNTTDRPQFPNSPLLFSSGFELSEPLLKRFPPEENPSTDSDGREVWNAPNFAIDDVAEMSSRTADEGRRLRQIQDRGNDSVLELGYGCAALVRARSMRRYRRSGGGHKVLRFRSLFNVYAAVGKVQHTHRKAIVGRLLRTSKRDARISLAGSEGIEKWTRYKNCTVMAVRFSIRERFLFWRNVRLGLKRIVW